MSGPRLPRLAMALAFAAVAAAGAAVGAVAGGPSPNARVSQTSLPGFNRAVFLSHVNNPAETPGFPGDPEFSLRTVFTVPRDGFYLQVVREGEHTGTHYSAPCHFHTGAICANQMSPGDFILPAVVLDVRDQVADDVDYEITVQDLKDWEAAYGPMPQGAAVIGRTGCSRFWGPRRGAGIPTYYNCGSGRAGFHQPGFSERSVRWLLRNDVLSTRGALGTDTFGPDPGTDPKFLESSLTLRKHRFTLENLTNLGLMPPSGGWIVIGGPRNRSGSGAPGSIFGLVP
jgi:kynurenine formamidase